MCKTLIARFRTKRTNVDRAKWALSALDEYTEQTYGNAWFSLNAQEQRQAIASLMADLMHLMNYNNIDPLAVTSHAQLSYDLQVY